MYQLVYLLCLLLPFLCQVVKPAPDEARLYEDLLKNYSKLERPVADVSETVTVHLSVILQQLIDVDERTQHVTINGWLKYTWNDYKLKWIPNEYGDITDLRFDPDVIWKPDIFMYNNDDPTNVFSRTSVVGYSDGTINYIPPNIFKFSCEMDLTRYPFDSQNCFMKFGSWTYDGTKLDVRADLADVIRSEKYYACCPEPYPALRFHIHLQRRTTYYWFKLIIPCMLITAMTILSFLLPPDAKEKIGLQITLLLSLLVLMVILSDSTAPPSNTVPLLYRFFLTCLFLVSASVVSSVIVLNLHYRTHEMGSWTRSIMLDGVSRLLCVRRPEPRMVQNEENQIWINKAENIYEEPISTGGGGSKHDGTAPLMAEILSELKLINKRFTNENEKGKTYTEWMLLATTVDRMCLVLFIVVICGFFIRFAAA